VFISLEFVILLYGLTLYFLSYSLSVGIVIGHSITIAAKQMPETKDGSTQSQEYDLLNSWFRVKLVPFSFSCESHSSSELLREDGKFGAFNLLNSSLQMAYDRSNYKQNVCIECRVCNAVSPY
jgi:hypothetical protein